MLLLLEINFSSSLSYQLHCCWLELDDPHPFPGPTHSTGGSGVDGLWPWPWQGGWGGTRNLEHLYARMTCYTFWWCMNRGDSWRRCHTCTWWRWGNKGPPVVIQQVETNMMRSWIKSTMLHANERQTHTRELMKTIYIYAYMYIFICIYYKPCWD